jgi:hypothetical protein
LKGGLADLSRVQNSLHQSIKTEDFSISAQFHKFNFTGISRLKADSSPCRYVESHPVGFFPCEA